MEGTIHNNLQNHIGFSHNQKSNFSSTGKGEDLLTQAVIDLYVNLKQRLKQFSSGKISIQDDSTGSGNTQKKQATADEVPVISEEEKKRLAQLGNLVVIDYIRSSMDILLNLKIEGAMLDLKEQNQNNNYDNYINSSRGGHGAPSNHYQDMGSDTLRSQSEQSVMTQREGPPKVYEEIIIGLEGDVRKHIRIEQQLKLHIESIEFRLDELENENEKQKQELVESAKSQENLEVQHSITLKSLEKEIQSLKQELKDLESKHSLESRSMLERFEIEKDQLTSEIQTLQTELQKYLENNNNKSNSKIPQTTHGHNQHPNRQSSISNKTTEFCSQCRSLISPSRTQPFSQYLNDQIESNSGSKNKNDLSLDTLDKRFGSINASQGAQTSNSQITNKKIFFKRGQPGTTTAQSSCNCPCQVCVIAHQPQNELNPLNAINNGSNSTKLQKQHQQLLSQQQFLEKSFQIQSSNNPILTQDQNDLLKMQKEMNKFMIVEKRQSTSKQRNKVNSNGQGGTSANINMNSSLVNMNAFQNLNQGTPDKNNNNLKGMVNALNLSMSSAQTHGRKQVNSKMTQGSNKKGAQQQMLSNSYLTQNDDNPYLGSQNIHSQLIGKILSVESNQSKNQVLFDHSSNSSLNQNNDNSMVIIHNKKAAIQRSQIQMPHSNHLQYQTQQNLANMMNSVSGNQAIGGGLSDNDLSFMSGMRQGMSNDGMNQKLIMQYANKNLADIQNGNIKDEDQSADSILNSHRRSRSQTVGGQSKAKSDRKGGRMLMMKNRLIKNQNPNDILRSGTYQSTKNGSINRETTPLKNINSKNLAATHQQMGQTILNSEDRKKLFNTFMKEMNQSISQNTNLGSANKKKKSGNNLNDSFQQMRGISNSSSRPRSQLAVQQNLSQNNTMNNYSSIVNTNNTNQQQQQQQQQQANLKYKFVSSSGGQSSQGVNQSRNHAQINKIKDFFQHNTYNPQLAAMNSMMQQQQQQQHQHNHQINQQQQMFSTSMNNAGVSNLGMTLSSNGGSNNNQQQRQSIKKQQIQMYQQQQQMLDNSSTNNIGNNNSSSYHIQQQFSPSRKKL